VTFGRWVFIVAHSSTMEVCLKDFAPPSVEWIQTTRQVKCNKWQLLQWHCDVIVTVMLSVSQPPPPPAARSHGNMSLMMLTRVVAEPAGSAPAIDNVLYQRPLPPATQDSLHCELIISPLYSYHHYHQHRRHDDASVDDVMCCC